MIDQTKELEILNGLINFDIPLIPENTQFWMIRTQGGYFYDEFITRKFVALAWNNIDKSTVFSDENTDYLKDKVMVDFPKIRRPSGVISKCLHFIHDVKKGDIFVIPSKGSKRITFAQADEYFEDSAKTLELEKAVISRIDNKDVDIQEVSCPYKKRWKIVLLRTVSGDALNISLYRAIANRHGISNLTPYAHQILNELYNCYTYKEYTVLVYNIQKSGPIKPRELSRLMYGNTECLCQIISENNISTKTQLHSLGDVVYILENAYDFAVSNWKYIFGLLVVLGGGSALGFKVPGIIEIIKNALLAKEEVREKKLDNESKKLDIQLKRFELQEKIKASDIKPETLLKPLEAVAESSISLEAEPIILGDEAAIIGPTDSENEESTDIEDE